ncbi:hypothetical protein [Pseudarthrobacter oxydans]|uniref:Uncharacterized protein n=1 Tax=Pseudarthrobacter oxydans TaxID=1671 RepID=A0AAW8N7B5_PSEOX|nr:hypothetical protein [Pseudarthrobacter oxydans]MDR6790996.1 hypothetical protein [Pseudarthrobacter oxydans]MDR7162575.1 hypothetical protein [Pseudarthrobacter oxydans]
MADAMDRKHGRRRGPGPAKGSRRLAVLVVFVLVVLAVAAFALTR